MYISLTDIENFMLITIDETAEDFVTSLIGMAQEFIENSCGDDKFGKRKFEAPSPDDNSTRYFSGNGKTLLPVGDLKSINTLVVDNETFTVDEDFYLFPYNASADSKPYTHIELVQPESNIRSANPRSNMSINIFEEIQRNVQISGKWYYSSVAPSQIKLATLKLVSAMLKENVTDTTLKAITAEALGEYNVSYEKTSEIADRLGISSLLTPYMRSNEAGSQKIGSGYIQAQ